MVRGHSPISGKLSKFDLMVSLFDSNSENRRTVAFQAVVPYGQSGSLNINQEIQVRMEGIEREDGSGENWNFHGYQQTTVEGKPKFEKVKGFFSTRTQTGWIEWPEVGTTILNLGEEVTS